MKWPQRLDVSREELQELLACARQSLEPKHYLLLQRIVETLLFLSRALEDKSVSLKRLMRMVFGHRTEKTEQVLPQTSASEPCADRASQPGEVACAAPQKKVRKGHGRNGASKYTAAERIPVPHETLVSGVRCPHCEKGRVYSLSAPAVVVRVVGQAPLNARVYKMEKLRCNLCGEVFTAEVPEEARGKKYDEAAGSMIALLKYGTGVPFHRLERLQESLGIPLPASTQWEIVDEVEKQVVAAGDELLRQGAQGELFHNDDTVSRILALVNADASPRQNENLPQEPGEKTQTRSGLFTTAIISEFEGHRIALFRTGRNHAGENLAEVLARREAGRPAPIQMCDGLSRNVPKEFETLLANCLAHGRRQFVEVADNFPQECGYLLEALGQVYGHEATCKQRNLSPDERLRFHQQHSAPVMQEIHRWQPLTLFLRKAGAPLDNNLCERALKKAILHRKNSYFFKTQRGAQVGDSFMSLIHTCALNGANAFDYLTELQKNAERMRHNPEAWMPWNYRQNLSSDDQAVQK